MTEFFFTSDQHFGHGTIITYAQRPFLSVEEMDEELIRLWNAQVGPKDVVYQLGDLTLRTTRQTLDTILPRLNGEIHFIPGNHDSWWTSATKTKQAEILKYLTVEPKLVELKGLDVEPITLCHFPMLEWNGSQHGSIHLHGHTHNIQPDWYGYSQQGITREGDIMGVRLNVCVENWGYRPVPWPFIKSTAERLMHAL